MLDRIRYVDKPSLREDWRGQALVEKVSFVFLLNSAFFSQYLLRFVIFFCAMLKLCTLFCSARVKYDRINIRDQQRLTDIKQQLAEATKTRRKTTKKMSFVNKEHRLAEISKDIQRKCIISDEKWQKYDWKMEVTYHEWDHLC